MALLYTNQKNKNYLDNVVRDMILKRNGVIPKFGIVSLVLERTPIVIIRDLAKIIGCHTACTDGVRIMFDEAFLEQMFEEEKAYYNKLKANNIVMINQKTGRPEIDDVFLEKGTEFILMHEVYHIVMRHASRLTLRKFYEMAVKEPTLYSVINVALDLKINSNLRLGFPEQRVLASLMKSGMGFDPASLKKYPLMAEELIVEEAIRKYEQNKQDFRDKFQQNAKNAHDVKQVIIEKMVDIYEKGEDNLATLAKAEGRPTVLLFVGVNGVGKTTTIGKIAWRLKQEGHSVLLAAGDTFRAGAIQQLEIWGERVGVPVVSGKEGGDPSSVVYDAIKKAKAENIDYLLIDTAGRLQNKVNLMKELEKMNRIISREIETGADETLLVLDATTGQNALVQAKQFKETIDVTGLILTKLDGTAKGGVILSIRHEMNIPVKFIGLGEKMDDLQPFDSTQFIFGLVKDSLK